MVIKMNLKQFLPQTEWIKFHYGRKYYKVINYENDYITFVDKNGTILIRHKQFMKKLKQPRKSKMW